jgi:hypothetical protein
METPVHRLKEKVVNIANLLALRNYDQVVDESQESRLSASDLHSAIEQYGRTLVSPPATAYDNLDAIQISSCQCPTWSVRAPIWTMEEGMSDLTLELTIMVVDENHTEVEIEDLHVL